MIDVIHYDDEISDNHSSGLFQSSGKIIHV